MTHFPVRWLCTGTTVLADGNEKRCRYVWEDWSTGTIPKARKRMPGGQQTVWVGPGMPEKEMCPSHPDLPLKKGRKTPNQYRVEAMHKAFFIVGANSGRHAGPSIYRDVGKRKAKCHMCLEMIEPGLDRIAFDSRNENATTAMNGGIIAGRREYVHLTCFIDGLMGGKKAIGKGCLGCTAKIADKEFQAYKKGILNAKG